MNILPDRLKAGILQTQLYRKGENHQTEKPFSQIITLRVNFFFA
jgi:hypothetical protein